MPLIELHMILLNERRHLRFKIALPMMRFLPLPLALSMLPVLAFSLIIATLFTVGCSKPSTPAPSTAKPKSTATYPPRPSIPAPPIKLFHAANDTYTLTTVPAATDDQIVAILYALRDAAHNHAFDTLHLPQKSIDARKPIAWFHIYRGPQCAPEKYADKPPCGASYHAAGDFTLGSYTDPNWNSGTLLHNTNTQGDGAETPLWNPDAPNQ